MARRQRGADGSDPYEQAAARLEADRRSKELGDPMPVLPPELATAMPDRRRMRRTLYLVGGVLLILVVGRIGAGSRAPSLPASCSKLQIAVSPAEARQGGGVTWSATGPPGQAISVSIGGRQVSRPSTALVDCKATGKFVVPVGPGRYDLTVRSGVSTATARLIVAG